MSSRIPIGPGGLAGAALVAATLVLATPALAETASPEEETRVERVEIQVGALVFEALATGPAEGDLVLLLHGFPQTGHSYRHQLAALGRAGYRAVAPDQRGYSPGARPTEVEAYAMGHLVSDVVGMADSLGRERFHLVGHDWGGAVAWVVASSHPGRVRSLSVLSTPHYLALRQSFADPDSDQSRRSAYFSDFAAAGAEHRFLADDMAVFRSILEGTGAAQADRDVYLARLGTPAAMRAALNWYSALVAAQTSASGSGASRPDPSAPTDDPPAPSRTADAGRPPSSALPPRLRTPTLYLWGTEDPAFGRIPAQRTAEFVAGPYEFHALDGAGHWLPEERAETVSRLLVQHLGRRFSDLASTPPRRGFAPEPRVFVSADTPSLRLPVPTGFVYLGRLGFPLKEIAWVDRHLFAELRGERVVRMIVLQFEGLVEGAEGAYRFAVPAADALAGSNYRFSPAPVRLGGHDYVHNTWAFDQRASAAANPGHESDRLVRYLEGRGLRFDDGWIMSRFVRAVGAESRSEIILFYLAPLSERGRDLAEFPEGGPPSPAFDELSAAVTRESMEIFRKLEAAHP